MSRLFDQGQWKINSNHHFPFNCFCCAGLLLLAGFAEKLDLSALGYEKVDAMMSFWFWQIQILPFDKWRYIKSVENGWKEQIANQPGFESNKNTSSQLQQHFISERSSFYVFRNKRRIYGYRLRISIHWIF